jgi:osmotically-inducible protein OsmY
MTRKYRILAGLVPVAALAAWTCLAQEPRPTVGDRVDNAVQNLKRGARDVKDSVRVQLEKARTSVHDMNVTTRIYGRLHWDKALNGSKLDIHVREDGVATLMGAVPDARARAKAVELTRDTVGVTQVNDQLTVQATTTTTTSETISTPAGTTTKTETKKVTRP